MKYFEKVKNSIYKLYLFRYFAEFMNRIDGDKIKVGIKIICRYNDIHPVACNRMIRI